MPTAQPQRVVPLAEAPLSTFGLYQRLETLLTDGGDARLALCRPEGCNAYGATPYPRPDLLDFASSTGSSISERGYAQATRARAALLVRSALVGPEQALQDSIEEMRGQIRRLLDIPGAEILFSPSGTDAQLQALFLVRGMLGTPLVTVIVGADQTGSGTVQTARGRHFSNSTARGTAVTKGDDIAGLAEEANSVAIAFCDLQGRQRSAEELDRATTAAVAQAVAAGARVLLQTMDASKLGWSGPSDSCLNEITARWPQQVRVVVDACQMRLGPARLAHYLARGFLVLMTGSKFFGGPSFSGAVLVPQARASKWTASPPRPRDCMIMAAASTGRCAGAICAMASPLTPIMANGCAGRPRWRKCRPISACLRFFAINLWTRLPRDCRR